MPRLIDKSGKKARDNASRALGENAADCPLEAMAAGLAVVASRVGGNPEIIAEGRSGWLFTAGDAVELSAQLEHLTRDASLRRELGQAPRARVEKEFSLEGMIDRYRDLYLRACRKKIPGIPEE